MLHPAEGGQASGVLLPGDPTPAPLRCLARTASLELPIRPGPLGQEGKQGLISPQETPVERASVGTYFWFFAQMYTRTPRTQAERAIPYMCLYLHAHPNASSWESELGGPARTAATQSGLFVGRRALSAVLNAKFAFALSGEPRSPETPRRRRESGAGAARAPGSQAPLRLPGFGKDPLLGCALPLGAFPTPSKFPRGTCSSPGKPGGRWSCAPGRGARLSSLRGWSSCCVGQEASAGRPSLCPRRRE